MNTGTLLKLISSIIVFLSVTIEVANADVPALSVSSNQITSSGDIKSFPGINVVCGITDLNQEGMNNENIIKLINDDSNNKVVRVALESDEDNSYTSIPEANMMQIERLIDAAIADDKYAVIAYQSHDAEYKKAEAISFFEQMALKYGTYNNIIYEIYIDPLQNDWDNVIKPYAEDVISAIRSIDTDNLIMVDAPGSTQDVFTALQNLIMGDNIAYALQLFRNTEGQSHNNELLETMSSSIPLILMNWGTDNVDNNSNVVQGWSTPDQSIVGSVDSIGPLGSGGLTINLINISDFADLVLDVGTDVETNTDVNVDVEVDKQININDLEEMAEQIMSDDLVDAVDDVLSSDFDDVVDETINSDMDDVIDQNETSDSIESGDVTINLINISDFIDMGVDVDTDVETNTGVNVGVDVDKQINANDLDELDDQIMNDDPVDAIDQIFNNDLFDVIDQNVPSLPWTLFPAR